MLGLYKNYVDETANADGSIESFRFKVPDDFNFAYDIVDRIAEEEPGRRAMTWCNDAGEERVISFGEMKRESDRAASFFRQHGIRKGDRVMLILIRHYQFWFAIIGLHKLGAVAIPGTNQLQVKDLVYRFSMAKVKMVVCTALGEISDHVDAACLEYGGITAKAMAKGKKDGWLSFEEGLSDAPAFIKPEGDDLARTRDMLLLYFTSGTTGMPKMVVHDHSYPIAHLATARYWHKVDPDGLHLTVSETGWAKSVWGKLYGQWIMEAGIFVYDMDRFVPDLLLRKLSQYNVTTFCAPPTIYRFLIKEDLSKYDLSSLQHCTIAGEALNPEVYDQFLKATGLQLKEGFGQTETTLSAATFYWMKTKPGSMGPPSAAYDVRLLDEDGSPTRPGSVGEITIRTGSDKIVGMFLGYLDNPELTGSVWHDGVYHTGDTAWQDEDGYLWYVGRMDDIIKSSGYRIGPFEVESVLMEHPAVLECAVTGAPDTVRGTVIKATVVLARGYSASDELRAELQNYVKTHTAPYKYPRILEFVPSLPKTISGKIMRKDIRQASEDQNEG
ncbi:MAG: AMP-binding protein [Saccharofermentanales bacterium]